MVQDNSTDLLVCKNLRKSFGRTLALNGVSFSISSGECVHLSGDNGSGKSTLLESIAGLLRPEDGEITLGGISVYGDKNRNIITKRHLLQGYVGEELQLYAELSIEENLKLWATLLRLPQKEELISCMLADLNLEASCGKPIRACSQGIAKRAAIAKALLHRPRILILDEPFANLDAVSIKIVGGILLKLAGQGASILFSAHELGNFSYVANRVLTLKSGRIFN